MATKYHLTSFSYWAAYWNRICTQVTWIQFTALYKIFSGVLVHNSFILCWLSAIWLVCCLIFCEYIVNNEPGLPRTPSLNIFSHCACSPFFAGNMQSCTIEPSTNNLFRCLHPFYFILIHSYTNAYIILNYSDIKQKYA